MKNIYKLIKKINILDNKQSKHIDNIDKHLFKIANVISIPYNKNKDIEYRLYNIEKAIEDLSLRIKQLEQTLYRNSNANNIL